MEDNKPNLTLRVQPLDETNLYQIVEFNGEMDKEGLTYVKDKLEKLSNELSCKYLVFDFSNLNYINSEGIGFLMSLHSHLAKTKKNLILCSAKPHVKDVFMVIGIMSIVNYYDSLDEMKKKIA